MGVDLDLLPIEAENSNILEEGDKCPVTDCEGIFEYTREDSCACHINPPCAACVNAPLSCNKCWLNAEEYEEEKRELSDKALERIAEDIIEEDEKIVIPHFFVDQVNGDDSNPGTREAPIKTIDAIPVGVEKKTIVFLPSHTSEQIQHGACLANSIAVTLDRQDKESGYHKYYD